jgi:hypothetical protein
MLGRITAGNERGRVVEVEDDSANTGGYLIFTYADPDRSPEAFDVWVEPFADIQKYLDESRWEVEWLDPT